MEKEIKRRNSVHTFKWTDETVIDFVNEKVTECSNLYLTRSIEDFKNSERNKDIVWLKKNKELLSIAAIEKFSGVPETSLLKAINGSQKFPKKWEYKLSEFIKKLKGK